MSNDSKKRVLVTGAAGTYGRILRTEWGTRYKLRLSDINPVDLPITAVAAAKTPWQIGTNGFAVLGGAALPLQSHEEFLRLDTSDYDAFREACEGVHTLVHLAADPRPSADFHQSLLSANVVGVYNAFEAAAQAGCRRLVFASSVHAMLGYAWEGEQASPRPHTTGRPVNPPNIYGATKCWGEALCRVYANSRGLSCIAIRLTSPVDSAALSDEQQDGKTIQGWLSQGDAGRLFGSCVDAADNVRFGILNGISEHATNWLDISNAKTLVGYRPQDGARL
eukprot:COSAG01_NODE_108_length_25947_cov_25.489593_20_plen_279_part_00